MINALTLILIFALGVGTSLILFLLMMYQRVMRIERIESQIAQHVHALDTARLQSHLQNMAISVVEIDSEVTALKEDMIRAAQKHHLQVNNVDNLIIQRPQSSQNKIRMCETRKKPVLQMSVKW